MLKIFGSGRDELRVSRGYRERRERERERGEGEGERERERERESYLSFVISIVLWILK